LPRITHCRLAFAEKMPLYKDTTAQPHRCVVSPPDGGTSSPLSLSPRENCDTRATVAGIIDQIARIRFSLVTLPLRTLTVASRHQAELIPHSNETD
jgi:hypothetical protein